MYERYAVATKFMNVILQLQDIRMLLCGYKMHERFHVDTRCMIVSMQVQAFCYVPTRLYVIFSCAYSCILKLTYGWKI